MKEIASIAVAGDPKPQGSLTSFKHPSTGAIITPQKASVKDWRNDIRLRAQEVGVYVDEGPIGLHVAFTLRRPKSTRKRNPPSTTALAAKRPDIDKLVRAVLDALQAVWYSDDSQVVDLSVSKRVAEPGCGPGVVVTMLAPEAQQ